MPPQEDGAAAAPSASESAKATGAAGAVTIQIGTTVRIHGLKSKPELNGKEGVVTAQKEARWVVQPSGEGFAPLALKETNLAVVVAQEDAAAKQTQEVQQHVFFSFFPFFSFPFSPPPSSRTSLHTIVFRHGFRCMLIAVFAQTIAPLNARLNEAS